MLPLVCGSLSLYGVDGNEWCALQSEGWLVRHLRLARPHVFVAPAFAWSMLARRVRAAVDSAGVAKARRFAWARETGRSAGRRMQGLDPHADAGGGGGGAPGQKGASWGIARRLVYLPTWTELGLGDLRFAVGFGPPPGERALDFLLSLGLPVLNLYGQSECCGVAALSSLKWTAETPPRPGFRLAACGHALLGTELSTEAAGHAGATVHVRGRNVMMGYLDDDTGAVHATPPSQLPPYGPHYGSLATDLAPSLWVPGKWVQAEESAYSYFHSTQAIIHGVLDTGDLGQIDATTGLLTVHGRAAHRLHLHQAAPGGAASQQLDPTAFEARLAALLPFLAHAVVCAPRGAPFPVCLLAVRTLPGEVPSQRRAAKDVEVAPEARALLAESRADAKDAMTVADVRESPVVIARIVSGIQACPLPISAIWLL